MWNWLESCLLLVSVKCVMDLICFSSRYEAVNVISDNQLLLVTCYPSNYQSRSELETGLRVSDALLRNGCWLRVVRPELPRSAVSTNERPPFIWSTCCCLDWGNVTWPLYSIAYCTQSHTHTYIFHAGRMAFFTRQCYTEHGIAMASQSRPSVCLWRWGTVMFTAHQCGVFAICKPQHRVSTPKGHPKF